MIHEGGFQSTPAALNGCVGNLAGSAIADIASRLDPSIKVIVSAHTHAEYRCTITTGRRDPAHHQRLVVRPDPQRHHAHDRRQDRRAGGGQRRRTSSSRTRSTPPAPASSASPTRRRRTRRSQAVVNQYVTASAPLANQVIGRIQGDLTRTGSPLGESTLGDVIADAQLAATQPANLGGAQLAFMNPGGIRADLRSRTSPRAARRPARSPTARRSPSSRSATAWSPRR